MRLFRRERTRRTISLSSLIKQVIGRRVLTCAAIFIVLFVGITVYDLSVSVGQMGSRLYRQLKPLEDFTISQIMIGNTQAVYVKLKKFNKDNPSLKVDWNPYGKKPPALEHIVWVPLFSWKYNYQLGDIAGYHFGYFKVQGSFLTSHILMYVVVIRLLLLIVFLITIVGVLYPLAKKVPEKLFVVPINRFMELIASSGVEKAKLRQGAPIELQALETKLIELLSKAQEQERNQALAQIGQLTRSVAHDLRNYLAGLHETVNGLDIPADKRDALMGYLDDIYKMAENLLKKYRGGDQAAPQPDVLEEVQSSGSEPAPILPLTSQASRAVYLAQIRAALGVKVQIVVLPGGYHCFIQDRSGRLKRHLGNLLTNALEAKAQRVTVTVKKDAGQGCIVIADDGCGIPSEVVSQLGRREITFGKENGNGIGLYQAIQDIESQGGTLTVQSEEGKGTCITIKLPCVEKQPDWFLPTLDLSKITTVVILDDDSHIHQRWLDRLKDREVEIKSFSDPETFAHYIQNLPNRSGLLFLCDYQLGVGQAVSGLDLIEQHDLAPQAVLVTGKAEELDVMARCQQLGVKLLSKENIAYVPVV